MGTVLVLWTKFTTCWSKSVWSRFFCWTHSKTISSTALYTYTTVTVRGGGGGGGFPHKMYFKTTYNISITGPEATRSNLRGPKFTSHNLLFPSNKKMKRC